MTDLSQTLLRDDSQILSREDAFFANLNLDAKAIMNSLLPMTEMICHRIENTYRSPAKLAFMGTHAQMQISLRKCMQFDDICLQFRAITSNLEIFLLLSARLARTLLIRLLATPLIDDSNSLAFSSTEKGIFSFIAVRLLFDLKSAFKDRVPDFKLMGVYHAQDEAMTETSIKGYGLYNFSFTFAADIFPISIAVPKDLFKNFKISQPLNRNLMARCGHLRRLLIFPIVTLSITQRGLLFLDEMDLVMFDHTSCTLKRQTLSGSLHAYWDNFTIFGQLFAKEGAYQFSLADHHFSRKEDSPMEELNITHSKEQDLADRKDHQALNNKLFDLAHDIRVALSIEISRLPMTLKEICDLRDGEVIDLHRKIDDPLEMRVENKIVGFCQPVQIDGRLGIRIISINGNTKEDI